MSDSTVPNEANQQVSSPERVRGITALTVGGFKSLLEDTRVEIRPLTILAGANSSGKSSIVQPVLLLKQTLDATYDPGPLLLDGPNVRFTSADQFLAKRPRKAASGFRIKIEAGDQAALALKFQNVPGSGVDLAEMVWQQHPETLTLRPEMTGDEIFSEFSQFSKLENGHIVPFHLMDKTLETVPTVIRKRCFLTVSFQIALTLLEFGPGEFLGFQNADFSFFIRSIIHVPGLRGNPERTYRTTGLGRVFPGTLETYVASIVNHWQTNKQDEFEQLAECLRLLGLTWKVEAQPINETQVELKVGRLLKPRRGGACDLVNIADVGFGVSQVLPVVVALLVAEPGQMVYIEQPEIHLHPKAQVALASVLVDAAKRGVRVVAETHSDLLLLAIQTAVAEGAIDPQEVVLHWFERGADGSTQVKTSELDEQGAYGDWPEDFADVALKAESRYLDAAGARKRVQ